MTRTVAATTAIVCLLVPAACAGVHGKYPLVNLDLGLVPIGGIPKDIGIFTSTDCANLQPKFADCSAQDASGRRYAFLDGALSRVSVNNRGADRHLRLPAGVAFGEKIESAAKKVEAAFGMQLKRGKASDGRVVYSSVYDAKAATGIDYAVELSADDDGRLSEFVERTDF